MQQNVAGKKHGRGTARLVGAAILLGVFASCATPPPAEQTSSLPGMYRTPGGALDLGVLRTDVCWEASGDLARVLNSGTLRVALPSDATTWYLHRGDIRGFEYTILSDFAASLAVELEVVRMPSVEQRHVALLDGTVDLIGGRLADLGVPGVQYGPPLATSMGIVVQRIQDDGARSTVELETVRDLYGLPISVLSNQGWHGLEGLIEIDPLPDFRTTESVLRDVQSGDLEVAVVRDDLALRAIEDFSDLVLGPVLDVEVGYHIAGRSSSEELYGALNKWVDEHPRRVRDLAIRNLQRPSIHSLADGNAKPISPFDPTFWTEADSIGWDTHLLMAQAYQESHFKPTARSFAGARGIMQLMPRTARELQVYDVYDPEASIAGGAKYLAWLDRYWRKTIPDPLFREQVVLASYNAGLGHVGDAMRLADHYAEGATDWNSLRPWLLALESAEYFRDPVVKYGYCRGSEPTHYVERIQKLAVQYRLLDDASADLFDQL